MAADLRAQIATLIAGAPLSEADAFAAASLLASGGADPLQLSALVALLAARGETAAVLSGFARALRAAAVAVDVGAGAPLVEIVGTGGDGLSTQNISTAAAVLAAACGARVAKHGSVSVTSASGAADVLLSLGVARLPAARVRACVERAGIAFLFAPLFHPALRHAAPVRAALKTRTVFNLLGPLLNPAGADAVVLGVFAPALLRPMAEALRAAGAARRALVVHCCGLDELAPLGPAAAVELRADGSLDYDVVIDAADWGVPRCTVADLRGGSPAENAAALRALLAGGDAAAASPFGQTVALNAGAALYVAGRAASVREGYALAIDALRAGAGGATLEKWVAVSSALAAEDA